jgi:hypothetical protein
MAMNHRDRVNDARTIISFQGFFSGWKPAASSGEKGSTHGIKVGCDFICIVIQRLQLGFNL